MLRFEIKDDDGDKIEVGWNMSFGEPMTTIYVTNENDICGVKLSTNDTKRLIEELQKIVKD